MRIRLKYAVGEVRVDVEGFEVLRSCSRFKSATVSGLKNFNERRLPVGRDAMEELEKLVTVARVID